MARDFVLSIDVGFTMHPKTQRFCRLMGESTAFGYLIQLWTWAVEAAPTGDLRGQDPADIEWATGYRGNDGKCYRALRDAGFIDDNGSPVALHNWMNPGRTGFAIRQMEAERRRWRRSKGIPEDSARNPGGIIAEATREAPGTPPPSRFTVHGSEDPDLVGSALLSASDPDPERAIPQAPYQAPREPKRPVDRFAAATSAAFQRVFDAYPRKDARAPAGVVFQELAATYEGGEEALADAILAAFPAMLRRAPYNGPNAKRPFLETVLAERRWEDPESAPDDTPAGAPRCAFHRLPGTNGKRARSNDPTCVECRHVAAGDGRREAEPTATPLPTFTPPPAWTDEQKAEFAALTRKGA